MSANDDPKDARLRCVHLLREAGFVTLAHELEHGSLASLGATEPVFVLCGRDRLAPVAIKAWIDAARLSNVPDSKLESAHLAIEAMERWPGGRHYPD
jgi:hypothetical protein